MKIVATTPRNEKLSFEGLIPGLRLLDILQNENIPMNAACGGKGTCHKCRIKLESGFAAQSAADRLAFSEAELAQGWRLSCQLRPKVSLDIYIPIVENIRKPPKVEVTEKLRRLADAPEAVKKYLADADSWRLAIDLGSTGLALTHLYRGETLCTVHLLNPQVRFGADVMTRLQKAQENGVGVLQKTILTALDALLEAGLGEMEKYIPAARGVYRALPPDHPAKTIFCAGNSAMTSFLAGLDISSLAVSPYQPIDRNPQSISAHESKTPHTWKTLPLLNGFVGGDTFAGIFYLQNQMKKESVRTWAMVDIGTNTEIVVSDNQNFWVTSAPAGPAFEGGNISSGMRAENGAVASGAYDAVTGGWKLETIGNDVPVGICGSGLIHILDKALQKELIQKDGFVPGGAVVLTEKVKIVADDVREFQLAKSATRTGFDILLQKSGIVPEKIFLAGNFAEHLKNESIWQVGLLPRGPELVTIGNASLKGVGEWSEASEAERTAFTVFLNARLKPVELALEDAFQAQFIKNLDF